MTNYNFNTFDKVLVLNSDTYLTGVVIYCNKFTYNVLLTGDCAKEHTPFKIITVMAHEIRPLDQAGELLYEY